MEHAFGRMQPFTVGVEEELLLVDPHTRRLAHVAEEVLPVMGLPAELADHEAYAAQVELRSIPRRAAPEATGDLCRGRAAARAAGATLMGAGLHPAAEAGDVRLVSSERYRRVVEEMRGLILRTPECALHVHVGMPDAETAIRVFNALRSRLPLLAALAANSPWWFGRDSGLASSRGAAVRAYPGRGVPRAFDGFDDYSAALSASAGGGAPDDYTLIWWDVRPHPRLGTVEVRELDAQSRVEDVAALAAFVQALARHEAERPAGAGAPTEAIAWSAFRASRDGLDAEILHDGRLTPVRQAARETLALVRPHARAEGGEEALDGIERILREGGGADRQRAAHARGGLSALLDHLVEETGA
jgi:carboxylate-amine ligase